MASGFFSVDERTLSLRATSLQKGGCNPRPIDSDARVANGRLEISVSDIEKSADLF